MGLQNSHLQQTTSRHNCWQKRRKTCIFCARNHAEIARVIRYLKPSQSTHKTVRCPGYILEHGLYFEHGRYFEKALLRGFTVLVLVPEQWTQLMSFPHSAIRKDFVLSCAPTAPIEKRYGPFNKTSKVKSLSLSFQLWFKKGKSSGTDAGLWAYRVLHVAPSTRFLLNMWIPYRQFQHYDMEAVNTQKMHVQDRSKTLYFKYQLCS